MLGIDRRIVLHFDWPLLALALTIAGLGVVSVLSASYGGADRGLHPLVIRQLIWIAAGTGVLLSAALFDYRALSSYAYPLYVVALVLLAVVDVAGHSTGGSQRWINLGVFRMEPSEIAKVALVLVMVRYLREEPPRGGWSLHQLLVPIGLIAAPAALVLRQPDLGSTLILIIASATLIFVAGLKWRTMTVVVLAALLAAPLAWNQLKPYQRQRLVSFVNPEADPLGSGYHIIQSEIAIGAGGTFGKGYLKGTQSRLNFLPEQSTDFVFAVFAEEFGFAGSLVLLGLYGAIIARGIWIARHARERYGALLAIGITSIIFWQVAINIGMATGMLPIVGITLPLMSYGGSSMLTMMAAMGILISINTRRYLF
ncbi:MAG: rod shape-determining protein RodA [Candidatus Binataceae bacterium]